MAANKAKVETSFQLKIEYTLSGFDTFNTGRSRYAEKIVIYLNDQPYEVWLHDEEKGYKAEGDGFTFSGVLCIPPQEEELKLKDRKNLPLVKFEVTGYVLWKRRRHPKAGSLYFLRRMQ